MYLPSLINSIKASPACFCSEFCHSCEQSSMTSSTTELLFLNVVNPLPSISNSWPCEPTRVLDKNGAKSTIISRSSGQTEPRAISSFCVSDASRDGVGTGKCSTRLLIGRSSGRGDADVITNRSGIRTTDISPVGFSPRSASPSVSCSNTFPSLSWLPIYIIIYYLLDASGFFSNFILFNYFITKYY